MKHLVFLSAVFLLTITGSAQVFDLYKEPFGTEPFFSREFADTTHIAMLEVSWQIKPDNKPIRDKGVFKRWYFSEDGSVTRLAEYTLSGAFIDSLVSTYTYHNAWPVSVRSHDAFGFYTMNFQRDSLGRITGETFLREAPGGKTFLLAEETARIETWPGQEKRTVLNAQGRPYKEEITYFDNGMVTGKYTNYIVGGNREELKWVSDKGRIISFYKQNSAEETEFRYNYESGKISGWDVISGNDTISRASVLWTNAHSWPEAVIIRNEEKKEVEILRFRPYFRP